MLKTNNKQFTKKLDDYIINSAEAMALNYGEVFKPEQAHKNIITHCWRDLVYRNKTITQYGYYNIFKEWMQGLPSGGIGDYYYKYEAVDLLGDMLEETETERNRFSEAEAEEKLTQLIYNRLNKVTNYLFIDLYNTSYNQLRRDR